MTDKELRNHITDNFILEDEEILIPNGYADAFLGITDLEPRRAVYSKQAMIEVLLNEDEMTYEDAVEWLEHNTWNAYVGENTPIYIEVLDVK